MLYNILFLSLIRTKFVFNFFLINKDKNFIADN